MTQEELGMLKSKVWNDLANKAYMDPNKINENDNLMNDIGLDSLDVVELIMDNEKHFNVVIPDNTIEGIKTVGDYFNVIKTAIEQR